MESNFHRKVTLNNTAELVNVSSSRLRHIFKEETGVTPAQYLRMLRMKRAKVLLETTFLRVKEVSISVGIDYDVSFVREFKKAYGVTPAKYRQGYLICAQCTDNQRPNLLANSQIG